jgi:hypothetical protein
MKSFHQGPFITSTSSLLLFILPGIHGSSPHHETVEDKTSLSLNMGLLTLVEDRPTPKAVYNWRVYTAATVASFAACTVSPS